MNIHSHILTHTHTRLKCTEFTCPVFGDVIDLFQNNIKTKRIFAVYVFIKINTIHYIFIKIERKIDEFIFFVFVLVLGNVHSHRSNSATVALLLFL